MKQPITNKALFERFQAGERIIRSSYKMRTCYNWTSTMDICPFYIFWDMISEIYGQGKPIPTKDRHKYFQENGEAN